MYSRAAHNEAVCTHCAVWTVWVRASLRVVGELEATMVVTSSSSLENVYAFRSAYTYTCTCTCGRTPVHVNVDEHMYMYMYTLLACNRHKLQSAAYSNKATQLRLVTAVSHCLT